MCYEIFDMKKLGKNIYTYKFLTKVKFMFLILNKIKTLCPQNYMYVKTLNIHHLTKLFV